MLPFENLFFKYGVGRYNTLSYLIFGLLFLWLTIFSRPRFTRKLEAQELLYLAFAAWALVTVLWAPDPFLVTAQYVTLLGTGACFMVFGRGLVDLHSIRRALWFFVVGSIILGGYAHYYYETSTYIQRSAADNYDLIVSTLGKGADLSSPELARATAVGFLAALFIWETEKRRKLKLVALGAVLLLGFYTLLTGNRSTNYGLLTTLLVWTLFSGSLSAASRKVMLVPVLLGIIIFSGLAVNEGALQARLVDTTSNTDANRFLSGRLHIWESAWLLFEQNYVTGIGLGQFQTELARNVGVNTGSHNGYLETLVETGVVGLALFVLALMALVAKAWKSGPLRGHALGWCVLFYLSLGVQGMETGKTFWFMMGIACALGRAQQFRRQAAQQLVAFPEMNPVLAARKGLPAVH
jgi:putative inorganic carbon (HCO3(-)) transporter